MNVESSRTTCSVTPGGQLALQLRRPPRARRRPRHRVGARLLLHVESDGGRLVEHARFFASSTPSTTCATSRTQIVVPPARLTGIRAISGAAASRRHAHHRLGRAAIGGAGRRSPRSRCASASTTSASESRRPRAAPGPRAPGSRAWPRQPGSRRPRRARFRAAASRSCRRCRSRPARSEAGRVHGRPRRSAVAPASMRRTIGSSISRGRSPRMAATLPRMSC